MNRVNELKQCFINIHTCHDEFQMNSLYVYGKCDHIFTYQRIHVNTNYQLLSICLWDCGIELLDTKSQTLMEYVVYVLWTTSNTFHDSIHNYIKLNDKLTQTVDLK